jgi:hypothetical protein
MFRNQAGIFIIYFASRLYPAGANKTSARMAYCLLPMTKELLSIAIWPDKIASVSVR